MTLQDVVIVGAGLAGLICAQRLQQAGYGVTVLEKSRGLGGRLATRRMDGTPIDHGARFLQPQGAPLQALTAALQAQGLLTCWQPHTYALDSTGQLNPEPLTSPYYVAPAGMSAIGKTIATHLTVLKQRRVIAIAPTPEQIWQVTATRDDDGSPVQYRARALVLALPAPQIVPLLSPHTTHPEMAAARTAIAQVQYAPCITVMAQYSAHTSQSHAPLPCLPGEPWMIEGHADTPFFWVGLDSSKRAAPGLNVVLHSSATYAEHWLATANLQPAGEALLSQAGKLIAPWLTQPHRWQVHRWRYARVEQACPQGPLSATTPVPWAACGDWCGDRQLDTAIESGCWAAAEINQNLGGTTLPPFSAAW